MAYFTLVLAFIASIPAFADDSALAALASKATTGEQAQVAYDETALVSGTINHSKYFSQETFSVQAFGTTASAAY